MSPHVESLESLVKDVPAMPVVAQRVMHMLGDPRTTNSALGEALVADQSLAARILQMANSPFFGTRQKIASISGAIFVLGHAALRSLIITVCTKGLYKHVGLMEQKLWEHALGTATASRLTAEMVGRVDPDEAFIAGLLHDIGQTVFAVSFRNDYERIFMVNYNQNLSQDEFLEAERGEFGYTHCEVGSQIITKWRLPGILARAARRHHTTDIEVIEKEENPHAVAIVAQANLITSRLGLGLREPDKRIDVIDTVYNKLLNIDRPKVLQLVEQTLRTYHEAREQFHLEK